MSRRVADQAIADLAEACGRVAVALYAVDSHRITAYLRTATLAGATLDRQRGIQDRIAELWARFGMLREVVDRVQHVRAARSRPGRTELAAITDLLSRPVVEADGADLVVTRLTADAARLLAELDDLDRVLAAVTERIGALDTAAGAVRDRLAELGLTAPDPADPNHPVTALDRVVDRLTAGAAATLRDPAGADPALPWAVTAHTDLQTLRERVAAIAAVRDGFADRVAALRDELAALAAEQATVQQLYARAVEKIRDPRLPPDSDAVPELAGLVDRLAAFAAGGDWLRVCKRLPAVAEALRQARAGTAERHAFAGGLLARREELRGRLDAYRMKAARTGRAEEPALAQQYQLARELLWTAPCDLPAATRAVAAYQRTLAAEEKA